LVPEIATQSDPVAVRKDLEYMTAHWHELPERAMFEIRAFKEHSQPQTFKYALDWMDDAVSTILDMNAKGYNIYAVRNPIRATFSGSAKDTDIIAARFLWADCDDPAAAGNVSRFDGP
jgi:vacuolar-type H+-ATPase subunit C/Vma6